MSESRTNGGRPRSRAFRPLLDGRLEDRVLMSSIASKVKDQLSLSAALLKHPAARNAYLLQHPPHLALHAPPIQGKVRRRTGVPATETLKGGEDVLVNAGGTHYQVALSYTSNTLATNVSEGSNGQNGNTSTSVSTALVSQAGANYPQPIGTVRAYAMSGGRVGLIVDGSTQNTELTINPLGQQQRKGFAKSFAYGAAARGHLLNIGQITVNSGQIGDIEGFQDAVLSGPLVVSGTTSIDRIAFDAILPGASITTGGDVQHARRAQRSHLVGNKHQHRPRPESAQRRRQHRADQRRPVQHWSQSRPCESASQGNGHGYQCPDAQLHECRELDHHRDDPRRWLLHPGERLRRSFECVQDRRKHL